MVTITENDDPLCRVGLCWWIRVMVSEGNRVTVVVRLNAVASEVVTVTLAR